MAPRSYQDPQGLVDTQGLLQARQEGLSGSSCLPHWTCPGWSQSRKEQGVCGENEHFPRGPAAWKPWPLGSDSAGASPSSATWKWDDPGTLAGHWRAPVPRQTHADNNHQLAGSAFVFENQMRSQSKGSYVGSDTGSTDGHSLVNKCIHRRQRVSTSEGGMLEATDLNVCFFPSPSLGPGL